jgi:hypothetical protein
VYLCEAEKPGTLSKLPRFTDEPGPVAEAIGLSSSHSYACMHAPRTGARVLARVGKKTYEPGAILKKWDEGNPYRIKLDSGEEVRPILTLETALAAA